MTMLTRMGGLATLVAAITAGPALADRGGVPHNGGGQGADHAAQPATPAQPARPAPKARAGKKKQHETGGDKPARAQHHSARTPSASRPRSSHAKAGKTTICHATGSESHPYVRITISDNAVPAHQRHQDGRDIVPATGDCPGETARAQTKADHRKAKDGEESNGSKGKSEAAHGKTTICHATGSVTNPFVKITISDHALDAHRRHQDGEDVIPAGAECPASKQDAGTRTPTQTDTKTGSSTPGAGTEAAMLRSATAQVGTPNDEAESHVLGERVASAAETTGDADAGDDTAGAGDTAGESATGTLAADEASSPARGSGLPFTGLDLGTVAVLGLALLLAGTALRRARRTSRLGS